jgi:glycosidase
MTTLIEPKAPQTLAEADLRPRGRVFPSPAQWRDQVLYFLLPDRFSDGMEAGRPIFNPAQPDQFRAADRAAWRRSGKSFQGGTLRGIASKLDYLKDLGVTALWIGPIWKQRPDLQTYHGYGIQHFLDVDPRFGTRQDLRDLVDAAHDRGLYVLLDVIYNHTGNNWYYEQAGRSVETVPYQFAPPHPFGGWRTAAGTPSAQILGTDDGAWPQEFQNLEWYTRAGRIGRWDPEPWEDPLHPDNEFRRGDFFDLKDLNLNRNDTLSAVIRAYQYWIALSDCDGFRIDTVKHISFEGSRNFCGAIREYAELIGKENFWLLGEVTGGGELTRNYLDIFGRNIDGALDIGEPAALLAGMVKGQIEARRFFGQFDGHDALGSHRQTGRYHVSILDDHDMVGRPGKHRFSANNTIAARAEQVAHAAGTQLTTLGIPCIYYGTEQALDGSEARGDPAQDPGFEDRYVRETMFGGAFGAFETEGCHFFDADHPSYLRIAAIARLRNQPDLVGLALRRGRQYQRETSFLGQPFAFAGPGELLAWSRVLHQQEVVVAVNSHGTEARGAQVTVDAGLHPPGSALQFRYRGDWSDVDLRRVGTALAPADETATVEHRDGRATVNVSLPPAGMAILA